MDSFEKAVRKMSAGLVEETNPTNVLYSASRGAEPVDFSSPDPMTGLSEVPGMQAQIDAAKAERQAAKDRAASATAQREEFMYGKNGNSGYNTQPGSAYAKYGSFGRDRREDLLQAERDGLLTLSPKFKSDLEKMATLESRAEMAYADKAKKEFDAGARVISESVEKPYRITDGRSIYPPGK